MSVVDGIKLRDVGKVGISNNTVRAEINKNPNLFIGSVIEIGGLKYDPISGKIREPIFRRVRPDLKAIDATWEKLQRDAMKI